MWIFGFDPRELPAYFRGNRIAIGSGGRKISAYPRPDEGKVKVFLFSGCFVVFDSAENTAIISR